MLDRPGDSEGFKPTPLDSLAWDARKVLTGYTVEPASPLLGESDDGLVFIDHRARVVHAYWFPVACRRLWSGICYSAGPRCLERDAAVFFVEQVPVPDYSRARLVFEQARDVERGEVSPPH